MNEIRDLGGGDNLNNIRVQVIFLSNGLIMGAVGKICSTVRSVNNRCTLIIYDKTKTLGPDFQKIIRFIT